MLPERKKAVTVGVVAIATYLANYFLRHMLSVLTPTMLKVAAGSYDKEYIALLSSLYMVAYAAGQLLNGVLGDIVDPKRLVLIGVAGGGLLCAAFPFLPRGIGQCICYALLGYGLSMVRGPLMKIISENTVPAHARLICVFFSFSSCAGPLVASLLALLFPWRAAFAVAGILGVVLAAAGYVVLAVLQKRGLIGFRSARGSGLGGILQVFKIKGMPAFLLITCVLGAFDGAVFFWIPTFLNEFAGLPETQANMTFSVLSTLGALMPFFTLLLLKGLRGRDTLALWVAYAAQAVSLVLLLMMPAGWGSAISLALVMMTNSIASALLWSIYIPTLGKTGRVSSINGVLDCLFYIAASAASSLSAWVNVHFGYRGLIGTWMIIPVLGLVAGVLKYRQDRKAEE